MEFALIKNGLVENTIVADLAFISGISNQYDEIIDVSNLEMRPWPGIPYDGQNFIYPPDPVPPPPDPKVALREKLVQDKANGKTNNPSPVALQELLDDIIELL